jgi:glutamate synthase domain-containing protein 3
MRIDGNGLNTREINRRLRAALAAGDSEVVLANPAARHNLAVGLLTPGRIRIEGSVGYYCGGLCDGPAIDVDGSAGWGLAENLMAGRVVVRGNAGNGAAASIRGGLVVVGGHAGARAGIAMKGGTLLVGGDAGLMTGFMMQKGTIVIGGNAGDALGDSLYEGRIFVAGAIASLGSDAIQQPLTPEDEGWLRGLFEGLGEASESRSPLPPLPPAAAFKKIVSARGLYHFDRREFARWREAL